MRRLVTLTALIGLLVVPLSVSATEQGENPVYLALGDSVGFGFGAERPDQHGYVAVLSRWARGIDCRAGNPSGCPQLELVNMSIPGATSPSLIAEQLPAAVELLTERNHDDDSGNDVTVVTVTIGGNDLFNPVVEACGGGITPECAEVVASLLSTYADNLAFILATLRTAAGPDTRIVMMTYYNPLGSCFLSDLEPLADLVLEGGGPVRIGMNDIIRATATATGVEIADTFGQLGDGDFVGGEDCLHPNKHGYHQIARVFRDVLR